MNRDSEWVEGMKALSEPQCQGMRVRHRADTIFLLVMGGRVITMQTGFAMLESAFGRQMNAANIMMKNTMDLLVGAIVFFFFGYWLAFDSPPQFDEENNFDYAMWFCQFAYATTAATIDSGALAGRVAFISYLVLSVYMTGFVYPLAVRWTWGGGWLAELGFLDFAGSGIVHLVGAASALVAAAVCGPRIGKFPNYNGGRTWYRRLLNQREEDSYFQLPSDETEKAVFSPVRTCTNPVQILFGVFILIIGFLAFNPASTFKTTDDDDLVAARATVVTLMAASAGALACIMWSMLRTRSTVVTVPDLATAVVGSMVASCACCNVVTPLIGMVVGFVAAMLALGVQVGLDRFMIDDPVGAVAAHGPPGIWGCIAVPLFAKPHCQSTLRGIFYGGGSEAWELLGTQCIGVLALTGMTIAVTYIGVMIIDLLIGFRCGRAAELIGLDFVEHQYDDGSSNDSSKKAILAHSPVKDSLAHRVTVRLSRRNLEDRKDDFDDEDPQMTATVVSAGTDGLPPTTNGQSLSVEEEVASMKHTLEKMNDQIIFLSTEISTVHKRAHSRSLAVQRLLEAKHTSMLPSADEKISIVTV